MTMKNLFISFAILLCMYSFGGIGSANLENPIEEKVYGVDYENALIESQEIKKVYYSNKIETDVHITSPRVPTYIDGSGSTNVCATNAAGSIIGHFDVSCDNLMPNFTPYILVAGNMIFYKIKPEIQTMLSDLIVRMQTKPTGTTLANFKSGFNSYVSSKGYTLNFTELSGRAELKNYLKTDKPINIFVSGNFSILPISNFTTATGEDTYTYDICFGNHIMAVMGYKVIDYYNASGSLIYSRTLLRIATGFASRMEGYLDLDSPINIDLTLGVNIF